MASKIAPALQQAVNALKADPSLLHDPSLGFFRDYLISLGAGIPVSVGTGVVVKVMCQCVEKSGAEWKNVALEGER